LVDLVVSVMVVSGKLKARAIIGSDTRLSRMKGFSSG